MGGMLALRHETPAAWTDVVLADLDAFLQDHAANERKVAASALWIAVHFPDYDRIVEAMVDLASEEWAHFRQVFALLRERGRGLGQDRPDPYMGRMARLLRKRVVREHLLDRLLLFGIVEARGHERFRMLAEALPPGRLRAFYERLVEAEARHHVSYLRLARDHFPAAAIEHRLHELLDAEAAIARGLPLRAALH